MRIITVEPGSSEEQSQPRKLQFAPDASEHMKNSMLDDFDAGMSEEQQPSARDALDNFNRLVGGDTSPSQSCNASQILMKSLMKSYNAGNVQFYENLHRKYFDKAKCAKNDPSGEDLPQELLDMTDDGMVSKVTHELSRLMVESRLNEGGSRSRSRSRGGNSNLTGASKFKHQRNNNTVPNEADFDQTQGARTNMIMDDDTNLFELTEKSNNTYMALSYWNRQEAGGTHRNHGSSKSQLPHHAATQGATPVETHRDNVKYGANINLADRDDAVSGNLPNGQQQHQDDESSNAAMSINFKNSIYSKIKYDPSVHNITPSMISARGGGHQPMHSDASASQISALGLTSKLLGRNGGQNETGLCGSVEDAESEVPANSFLIMRQKLLSSQSSPEIDIDEVMRRHQLQRSRLGGSNLGNKSVPNILGDRAEGQRRIHKFEEMLKEDRECRRRDKNDDLSRRDLSARPEDDNFYGHDHEEVTGFELGTQRSREPGADDEDVGVVDIDEQQDSPWKNEKVLAHHDQQQRQQIDFSEKVQNLMSPDLNVNNVMKVEERRVYGDTSSNFLKQLQNIASPESTAPMSYHRPNLLQQHHNKFLATDQVESNLIRTGSTMKQQQQDIINSTESDLQIEMPRQQPPNRSSSNTKMKKTELEQEILSNESDAKPKDNPSVLASFQEQVKLAWARRQSQDGGSNQVSPMTTSQQANLIGQQYESMPPMSKMRPPQAPQQELDGEGHRSDFTFVLSQPTQGGFTECHNCGVANGSILLGDINGSILQSQGLRSSIGDTSMQIRKNKIIASHHHHAQMSHGGTASFADGVLGNGNNIQLQSAKSSDQTSGQRKGLQNRLPEIAASPIYSESGGAPGRKFFMSLHQASKGAGGKNSGLPPYVRPSAVLSADQTSADSQIQQRKTNKLICNGAGLDQGGLRLSHIQSNGGEEQLSSQSPPLQLAPHNEPDRLYHQQVNNYMEQQQNDHEMPVHSDFDQDQQQQEYAQSRYLLLCTYDFLNRLLHDAQADLHEEAVHLMQAIQLATAIMNQQPIDPMSCQQQMIPEVDIENEIEDESNMHDQTEDRIVAKQQHQQEHSQQMTESEMNESKAFYLPKQLGGQTDHRNARQFDHSEVQNKTQHTQQLEVEHLAKTATTRHAAAAKLQNSLLSCVGNDDEDANTEYSFFAEESEIRPRAMMVKQGKKVVSTRAEHHDEGQTSFIASQSPRNYAKGEDGDENVLAKTQRELKAEKNMNKQQSDMLRQMQAQIDSLTYKWSITENQLRNNGAIYSQFQPNSAQQMQSVWKPTATSMTQNPYSVLGKTNAHVAPIDKQQRATMSEFMSPEIHLQGPVPPSNTTFASPFTQRTNQHQAMLQHQQHQKQSSSNDNASHQTSQLTAHMASVQHPQSAVNQSNYLIEINERLREQISTNTHILEHMQGEQQQEILPVQQEVVTSIQTPQLPGGADPTSSNQSLGSIDHANTNAENVQSLITLTKIAAEATIQAHSQHKDEMDRLRRRQMEFTAKIDKIGSKLSGASNKLSCPNRVGLKPSIRASSRSGSIGTLDRNSVQEGDGQESTFLDMTNDRVPTKD